LELPGNQPLQPKVSLGETDGGRPTILVFQSELKYDETGLSGRFGGGKFWLKFAFKKANR
jgi:hypothetical protein